MNTHISKELALWLKERGCEIQTEMFYKLTTVGQWHEGNSLTLGGDGSIENQKQPSVDAFLMPSGMVTEEDLACGDTIRTYSWYDILVTHAKEFWGEASHYVAFEYVDDARNAEEYGEIMKAGVPETFGCKISEWHGMVVLMMLNSGAIKQAEAYVREHSLFAKQDSKCKGCGEVKRCRCGDTVHEPYSGFDAVA